MAKPFDNSSRNRIFWTDEDLLKEIELLQNAIAAITPLGDRFETVLGELTDLLYRRQGVARNRQLVGFEKKGEVSV